MIITYQDKDYEFDQERVGLDEWRELKRKYQMTPRQFEAGLSDADPDTYTFLYWTMLRQNGGTREPLGDNLKFDLIALNHAVGEASEAEEKRQREEQEADPTPDDSLPDGKTPPPPGSSTKTSPKSATSTSLASPAISGSGPGIPEG